MTTHTETQARELFPADASGRHGVIPAVFQRAGWWPATYDANFINIFGTAPAANLYWRDAQLRSGEYIEYDRRLAYLAALKATRFAPGARFDRLPGRVQQPAALFYHTQFALDPRAPDWIAAWVRRSGAEDRRVLILADLYAALRKRRWIRSVDGPVSAETLLPTAGEGWHFSALCARIEDRIACCTTCAAIAKTEIGMLSGVLRQKKEGSVAMEHRRAARWRPDIAHAIMAYNMIAMIEEYELRKFVPVAVITDAWYIPAAGAAARESDNHPEIPGCFREKQRFQLNNESFISWHNRAMHAAAQAGKCGGIVDGAQ